MKTKYVQVPHFIMVKTSIGLKKLNFNKYADYHSYTQQLIREQYPHLFTITKKGA